MFKKIIFAFFLFIPQADAYTYKDLYCMTEAIYYEARNQPFIGQMAVAIVIRNRTRFKQWPDNVCDVVHEGYYYQGVPLKFQCQFTYWCDGIPENHQEDERAWLRSEAMAYLVLTENITIEGMETATHYHTKAVKPDWRHKFDRCATIGDHIFYCPKKLHISISN